MRRLEQAVAVYASIYKRVPVAALKRNYEVLNRLQKRGVRKVGRAGTSAPDAPVCENGAELLAWRDRLAQSAHDSNTKGGRIEAGPHDTVATAIVTNEVSKPEADEDLPSSTQDLVSTPREDTN
jgi:hypothetical protein